MKTIGSLFLILGACGAVQAQSGSTFSFGPISGVNVTGVSKTEPAEPSVSSIFASVLRPLGKSAPEGLMRAVKSKVTHEYFGYDLKVEEIDEHAGTYRVTFSPLTLAPEELHEPDAAAWHMLPPPLFPSPQIVTTEDTIVLDVFVNPATGQKIVDYIRLMLDNCNAAVSDASKVSCLTGLLKDAERDLAERLAQLARAPRRIIGTNEEAESFWQKYRHYACADLGSEVKRLQCELSLTRSRTHELGILH